MNKKEKRIRVMIALSMALKHSMSRHREFDRQYCTNDDFYACEACNDYGRCRVSWFLVSFYDKDGKLLSENYLSHSFAKEYSKGLCESKVINEIAKEEGVDINYLMNGKADALLHKVRHIEISLVSDIHDKEGFYQYTIHKGIAYYPFCDSTRLRFMYCKRKLRYENNGVRYLKYKCNSCYFD